MHASLATIKLSCALRANKGAFVSVRKLVARKYDCAHRALHVILQLYQAQWVLEIGAFAANDEAHWKGLNILTCYTNCYKINILPLAASDALGMRGTVC